MGITIIVRNNSTQVKEKVPKKALDTSDTFDTLDTYNIFMVSFIIIAKEKKKREAYVKEHANNFAINSFDITILERDTSKKNLQSIGIEDIKNIQEKIFLKPLKSTNKLIIIEDAHLLTPEAQNALLKVLEEPPAHTHIILATETKEALLPTILSRCQIIELEEEQTKPSEKTIGEMDAFIASLPELSLEERFKQAEQLAKDKDKAIVWIENLILVLREELLTNVILVNEVHPGSDSGRARMTVTDIAQVLRSFQSLHTLLKTTNVNPRFAIEQTLLNL